MNRPNLPSLLWTLFRTLLVALTVILIASYFASRRLTTSPIHSMIEQKLTEASGLAVKIDTLHAALLPTPHLEAEGIRIENLPGRKSREVLRIERVDLGLAFWPLLDRTLEIDTLSITGADFYLETDSEGKLAAILPTPANAAGDDGGGFRFDLRRLDIDALHVVYHDRSQGSSHTLVMDSVAIESKYWQSQISLDARGQLEGSEIVVRGEVGSLFELFSKSHPYPVHLEGKLFEARFAATGVVHTPRTLEGLDLEISGEIPELTVLDHALPKLGAIRFKGQVSNLDGSLGFETFEVGTARKSPAELEVHGIVDDLLDVAEIDVEARIDSSSLDFLAPLLESRLDLPLSAFDTLSAKAKISDSTGSLVLDGSARAATTGDAVVIRAQGKSEDLRRVAGIDIAVELQADDVASITSFFPEIPTHQAFGAVTAHADLRSHEHSLRADGIEISMGDRQRVWAEIDGSIQDVILLEGIDLELSFGASGFHQLREVLAREFPETSAFEGAAGIHDRNGSLHLRHARLHGGEESPIEIHLDARFEEVPGPHELEIDLGIRGDDLSTLAAIAGIDLPIARPVEFRGKFQGTEEHVDVEGLLLQLGDTHFSGSLSGSLPPHSRPALEARLVADEVRLEDLGLVPSEQVAPDDARQGTDQASDPHARLPFEDLRRFDLDLGLQFARVTGYDELDTRDVRFQLRLEDGLLDVPEATVTFVGGQLRARLRADARTPVPKLAIGIETEGMNLTRLMSQIQENTEFSGYVDAELDLEARGATVRALRETLAGSVGIAVRDGNAASKIAREFVVSLAAAVFRGFSHKEPPGIGCAVSHLEIEKGIARVHTLLLKEKNVTVTGTGRIDLVDGRYDLLVIPRTSNPGIIGLAPDVRVSGPIEAPRFKTIKRTLVTSFGRGLLKNALAAGGTVLKPFRSRRLSVKDQEERCRLSKVDLASVSDVDR